MKHVELVVFDFDGTIADSFSWFCDSITQAARLFRFNKPKPIEIEILRNMDALQILSHLSVPKWKQPFIAVFLREKFSRDIRNISLFPGIEDTIIKLKQKNFSVGIVSSNSRSNVNKVIGKYISSHIDVFCCGSSLFGKEKKILKAISSAKSTPSNTLYIGDEIRDIRAAKAVGAMSAAVSWGYNDSKILIKQQPDILFDTVGDILEKISSYS